MVNWYTTNQNFYGLTTVPANNVIVTEFESGKSRTILKNSTPKLIHTLSFLLRTKTEEQEFIYWYSNTLLSRTQTVQLKNPLDASENKEYEITEEPTINGSQYPKECTITIKEV